MKIAGTEFKLSNDTVIKVYPMKAYPQAVHMIPDMEVRKNDK